jgi:hypothetical protein
MMAGRADEPARSRHHLCCRAVGLMLHGHDGDPTWSHLGNDKLCTARTLAGQGDQTTTNGAFLHPRVSVVRDRLGENYPRD